MWLCRLALLVLSWAVCVRSSSSTAPTIIYERSGTNITLNCSIEGVSPIAWYYNNVPIDPVLQKQASKVIIGEGMLELIKVPISRGGWYTCASFSQRRDFLLIVGGEPKQDAFAPTEYVVVAGTRVELPCFFSGIPKPEITWFDDNGNQIDSTIDPITKSLVLFNVNSTMPTTYTCRARNNFSDKIYRVSFRLVSQNKNNNNVITPTFPSAFDPATSTSLPVPAGTTAKLSCGGSSNHTYQWLRNGVAIANISSKEYSVQDNSSSFYCCRLLENGNIVNTHCVTVFFQSPPAFRNPTVPPPVSLPAGRTANLLCLGRTLSIYDSPTLTWNSSVDHSQFVVSSLFGNGLAYLRLEIKDGVSGTYSCVANNSAGQISQSTMIEYVDPGVTDQLINGQAEAVNGNNEWVILDEEANLRTVANEQVFAVNFTGSIKKAALKQEVTIPDGVGTVYVRGRMRQSSSFITTSFHPAITVFFTDSNEETSLTFSFNASEAWQWVGENFSTNGSTRMFIKLEILGDSGSSKRQATNGTVYFDDISVSYPGVCSDISHFVCPMGSCAKSLNDCSSKDKKILMYIIIGAGGGVVLLLLAIIIMLCCCCLYCHRKKKHALPMKKVTTLLRKRTTSPSMCNSYTSKFDGEDNYENVDHQQTEMVRIPDAQSPEGDDVYTSVRGFVGDNIRSVDEQEEDTYYIQGPESVPLPPRKAKASEPNINGGHYTSLQPETLEQQTYYSSTSLNLPLDQRPRDGNTSPLATGEADTRDEGGVDLYLEVLPSTSQNPETSPTGFSNKTEVGEPPEKTNVVTAEIYDYVNADLGPN